MKLEIQKYKSLRTSRGEAYTCQLLADGNVIADVENRGDGGSTNYRWTDKAKLFGPMVRLEYEYMPTKVAAYVQALPAMTEFDGLAQNLDIAVENLVNDFLDLKDIKRRCKTRIIGRMPNAEKGTTIEWKMPYSKSSADLIRLRKPGIEILNETYGLVA